MNRFVKHIFIALQITVCYTPIIGQSSKFGLEDFFQYDSKLAYLSDSIYNSLSGTGRIAQMIITSAGELGKPESVVTQLAKDNYIGGVVFLKNSRENHIRQINELNNVSLHIIEQNLQRKDNGFGQAFWV